MGNRPYAVYEPGELEKTRQNLGPLDKEEAARVASLLGGTIGIEKSAQVDPHKLHTTYHKKSPQEVAAAAKKRSSTGVSKQQEIAKPANRIELAPDENLVGKQARPGAFFSLPRLTYKERILMYSLMAERKYQIKTPAQVLFSRIAFFSDVSDKLNPDFFTRILPIHIQHIESLILKTKKLIPGFTIDEDIPLKKEDPFSFSILETIRNWDIKTITRESSDLQKNAKSVTSLQTRSIVRSLYEVPVQLHYISDSIVITAYQKAFQLYKPAEGKELKFNPAILAKEAAAEWMFIKERTMVELYPLLLRLSSPVVLSYTGLFEENFSRVKKFLQFQPEDFLKLPSAKQDGEQRSSTDNTVDRNGATETVSNADKSFDEKRSDTAPDEQQKKESEKKPIPQSVQTGFSLLEKLFPEAGWLKLDAYPDLYAYFDSIFHFADGTNLIAPANPMIVVIVLLHVIEELLYGFRTMHLTDTADYAVATELARIMNIWRYYDDELICKVYVAQLREYCQQIDIQPEFKYNAYAKRLVTDTMWLSKSHFLPLATIETLTFSRSPRKDNATPFFKEVKELKKALTVLATGMENAIKTGTVKPGTGIPGIDDPWNQFVFEVSNPVSYRLEEVLGGRGSKNKTNANLVYYMLSIVSVLDWWISSPDSIAYQNQPRDVYRRKSADTDAPCFSVDRLENTDLIFLKSLKKN